MGTATATLVTPVGGAMPSAPLFVKRFTVALGGTYATGGETLDLALAPFDIPGGLANVVHVAFGDGWKGFEPEYVRATKKVLIRVNAAADVPSAEEGSGTDLTTITIGEMTVFYN